MYASAAYTISEHRNIDKWRVPFFGDDTSYLAPPRGEAAPAGPASAVVNIAVVKRLRS